MRGLVTLDTGAACRPHAANDTHFRPGPPLKEHIGLAVGYEGAGGFYVELSLDGLLVAAGLHNPAPDQVERIRPGVDDGRVGASLTRAIDQAEGAGMELNEPDLTRAPRGCPADHPRIGLMRRRRIVVTERHGVGPWLHGADAGDRIRLQLDAAVPLVRWLRERVGPSQPVAR